MVRKTYLPPPPRTSNPTLKSGVASPKTVIVKL